MSIIKAWLTTDSIRFRVRALKARLRDQRAEFDAIGRHLEPGDIACDIGANKGSFVFWLSRWCRGGRVVAFEPQPQFAERLAAVCRDLELDNVTVEAKAVYSRSGAMDLFVPSGHSPGASLTHKAVEAENFTTLSVPVVALDDYFGEGDRVRLLKIDVEGAELEVFKGAERILRQHAPRAMVFQGPHTTLRWVGNEAHVTGRQSGHARVTLEARLFLEHEIPWEEIAFRTVRETLKHFFACRQSGHYTLHCADIA